MSSRLCHVVQARRPLHGNLVTLHSCLLMLLHSALCKQGYAFCNRLILPQGQMPGVHVACVVLSAYCEAFPSVRAAKCEGDSLSAVV